MTTSTTVRPSSEQQRKVMALLEQQPYVLASDSGESGCASLRTLQNLAEKGLVEWDDRRGSWPKVQMPGRNAARRATEDAARAKARAARAARVAMLTADPAALAEAVVALEERLAALPTARR